MPCSAGTDGTVPITAIQTLGANSACDGKTVTIRGIVTGVDDLIGSSFDALYPADRGVWLQSATRDADAKTSSALFIAGIARNPAGVTADVGKDITITGTITTQFGLVELVPPGVGIVSSPAAHGSSTSPHVSDDQRHRAAAGSGRARQDAVRDPGRRQSPVLPRPPGHAGHAARGHRDRRRHEQVP